ncbi:MAG: ABC transporter permease [Firmicutes bacterium]|nr:ABC transporter permease [Bacillota bacterium]
MLAPAQPSLPQAAPAPPGALVHLWRHLVRRPVALVALVVLLAAVFAAVFAPAVAPYGPTAVDFLNILKPPLTPHHLLGTDDLGRDELSRIIYGARVSLLVGGVGAASAVGIGLLLGSVSGYFGGWLDTVIMRVVDVQLSFPFILLVLTVNAVLGFGVKNIIISLVVSGWAMFARLTRGEVLRVKHLDYVTAAVASGASPAHIIVRHVIPNVLAPVLVLGTLQVSQFMIAEATVSYLGFGVQPPTPAWGNMLAEGENYFYTAWWLMVFPGVSLLVVSLAINFFGDWLRRLALPG